jgi:hypothetical protein
VLPLIAFDSMAVQEVHKCLAWMIFRKIFPFLKSQAESKFFLQNPWTDEHSIGFCTVPPLFLVMAVTF